MMALERIKEIESMLPFKNGTPLPKHLDLNGCPDANGFTEEYRFLLKAFQVMRAMAIELRHDDGQFGWYLKESDYDKIIDKEFEERMK